MLPPADEVWAVEAEPSVALARLTARNQLSVADAQRRLDAQPGNEARRQHAQRVLGNNTDDRASLYVALAGLWEAVVQAHPSVDVRA